MERPGLGAAAANGGDARDARVRARSSTIPVNVVKINGVIRASTQVMFAEDEEIAHVAIGDAVSWEMPRPATSCFSSLASAHPATNLQVVTTQSRRPQALVSVRARHQRGLAGGELFRRALRLPGGRGRPGTDWRRASAVPRQRREPSTRALRPMRGLVRATGATRRKGPPLLEPDTVYDDGSRDLRCGSPATGSFRPFTS